MDKPPVNHELLTYLWVIGVSFWGGIVSYFETKEEQEKATGQKVPFSLSSLAVRVSSAGFAGIITMYMCEAAHMPGALTGAFCGIAAHMGTPALMKLKFIKNLMEKT